MNKKLTEHEERKLKICRRSAILSLIIAFLSPEPITKLLGLSFALGIMGAGTSVTYDANHPYEPEDGVVDRERDIEEIDNFIL